MDSISIIKTYKTIGDDGKFHLFSFYEISKDVYGYCATSEVCVGDDVEIVSASDDQIDLFCLFRYGVKPVGSVVSRISTDPLSTEVVPGTFRIIATANMQYIGVYLEVAYTEEALFDLSIMS